jgi:hypothetical protein
MNRVQWIVAAGLLAAMVFFGVIAVNYLGGGTDNTDQSAGDSSAEVTFLTSQDGPPQPLRPPLPPTFDFAVEGEEKARNHRDFWFFNHNDQAVRVGVQKGCQCSSVDVGVLPVHDQAGLAAATVGCGTQGPTVATTAFFLTLAGMQTGKDVLTYELLNKSESAPVPAGAVAWLRLNWIPEKAGPKILDATLWVDSEKTGKTVTLSVRTVTYEPIRVVAISHDGTRRPEVLGLGILRDEDLQKGLTRYLWCWSSTRTEFRLEAHRGRASGNAASDPFEVGTPEPLTEKELRTLEWENNTSKATADATPSHGRVLSGYKGPVTLRAMSADGKTPFDLGPFHRQVVLTSPDLSHDKLVKGVTVAGRVRGVVEVGNDDQGGDINFRSFRTQDGARESITLQSEVPGLKLKVNQKRTSEFLTARLSGSTQVGEGRQAWTLRAEALKGKAFGTFPRRGDPLFEDSAIYLEAVVPGKPPRSIRIPVRGTGNE